MADNEDFKSWTQCSFTTNTHVHVTMWYGWANGCLTVFNSDSFALCGVTLCFHIALQQGPALPDFVLVPPKPSVLQHFTPLMTYNIRFIFTIYNVFAVNCNKWGKHCSLHGDICSALSNMHPKHTVSFTANNGIVFHSAASSFQSWEANKTDWRYCDTRN